MAAQAVRLPAKVLGVVEAATHVVPVAGARLEYVGVGGHAGEAQDRFFVGDVGPSYVVDGPVVVGQLERFAGGSPPVEYAVDGVLGPVDQPVDAHRLCLDAQARDGLSLGGMLVLGHPDCCLGGHIETAVEVRVLVGAMVEDVPQREVAFCRGRGWRWRGRREDGQVRRGAHGEERQQQRCRDARSRGAQGPASHSERVGLV